MGKMKPAASSLDKLEAAEKAREDKIFERMCSDALRLSRPKVGWRSAPPPSISTERTLLRTPNCATLQ